jgi:hypothetical protein
MKSKSGNEEIIRSTGYTVISSFRLPDAGWWDHYYSPISERMTLFKEKPSGKFPGISQMLKNESG